MPDDLAFRVFKLSALGYCCTQIMIKMALEDEGVENADLVKSVNSLCNGVGGYQRTCGVLTGGVMIIGLYAGKGEEGVYSKDNYKQMVHEYMDWFENEFQSMDCVDIIGVNKFEDGENSYMVKCGDIIVKSYEKIVQILNENGYEFGERYNEN
jgi:C_GCAxxG_C_C family probable redox protein